MGSTAVRSKRITKTEYKYVSERITNSGGKTFYQAKKVVNGKHFTVSHETAKGAAKALDIKLIESGLNPINVLKKISL